MALDRQIIEKKDFPIGRRGYDPDAVDAHLGRLADEVEELKRSARRRSETLASAASEQVRTIVEAAERSATEIQRQAEEEAREIRAEASSEAQHAREQTNGQARENVGKLSESTATMLKRLESMKGEMDALFESLRTGSNRLRVDLQLLEGALTEVRGTVAPRPRFEPESLASGGQPPQGDVRPGPPAVSAPSMESFEHVFADTRFEDELTPAGWGTPAREPGTAANAAAASQRTSDSEDIEGARLIALNMALNGTPRDEAERYLEENFQVTDRRRLLDEVYASVAG